jgi:hypothetical protein
VVSKNKVKSMMAAKSLRKPALTFKDLSNWLLVLGTEIFNRVTEDFETNQRWPKTFTVKLFLLLFLLEYFTYHLKFNTVFRIF